MKYESWGGVSLITEECIWHCSRFDNQEYCTLIDIFLSLVLDFNGLFVHPNGND